MSDYRVIVTGSRDWPDPDAIRERLYLCCTKLAQHVTRLVVVHGASGNTDKAAEAWVEEATARLCTNIKIVSEPWPAKWSRPPRKGDPAGPIRNSAMAAAGANEALAFTWGTRRQSPGTWDCVEACSLARIPIRIFGRPR